MVSSQGPGSADPLVAELRRSGLVSLLVLHFVSSEPCYGNQLMDRIVALTAGAVSVNPNTMYPLLRSMETMGLVAGRWEDSSRRTRRFYRITAAGEAERLRLAGELAPNLDAIAATIALIRHELLERG
jgi:DNA-binding PadR family transcriptional regulator